MRQIILKLPVVLLSFYCLFLAVLPCYCSEPEVNTHAHITKISCQDTTHRHTQDSRVCTPFCLCAGVHNPNFFTNAYPVFSTMRPVTVFFSLYIDSVCHYHRIDIWRPPKTYMLL